MSGKGPVGDPFEAPRAVKGRAPDVFEPGGWMPMREYRDDDAVDFAIVGTGAGGGTLACRLAERASRSSALDAGPYFRPLDEFASDETEQNKLYWTDNRIVEGNDWMVWGARTAARRWVARTVHFAMVSLRFRPEWFKARTCSATAPTGRSIGGRCGATTSRPRRRSRFPAR